MVIETQLHAALLLSVSVPLQYPTFIGTVCVSIFQIWLAKAESAALAKCANDCAYYMSLRITVT